MTAALQEFENFKRDIFERGCEQGLAKGILAVLTARGLPVSADVQKRILGCTDEQLLSRWIARAAVVPSTEDVFA